MRSLLPSLVTKISRVRLVHGATLTLDDRYVRFNGGELSVSYGSLRRFETRVRDTNQLVATLFRDLALGSALRLHEETWSLEVVDALRVQAHVAREDLLAGADPSTSEALTVKYLVRMSDLEAFVTRSTSLQELLDRTRVMVSGDRVLVSSSAD